MMNDRQKVTSAGVHLFMNLDLAIANTSKKHKHSFKCLWWAFFGILLREENSSVADLL